MTTLLSILFLLVVLAIGLWITWNVIEVIYRVVMITICGIAYVAISVWEIITSAINFLIKRPSAGLLRLVR